MPTIIIIILAAVLVSLPFILKSDANESSILLDNEKDEYGCMKFAGYSWDEGLEKCVIPWETKEKTYCEGPSPEICTMDYSPVCGLYSIEIQCVKAPCGKTYSNGCSACSDEKVEFYTEGECDE